jgi:hypothetical protein
MTQTQDREIDVLTKLAFAGRSEEAKRGFSAMLRRTRSAENQAEILSIMKLLGLVLIK